MKVFAHINDQNSREAFWQKIKEGYKELGAFKGFLTYFEKYWLLDSIVRPPQNFREKLERTNNICERFHRHFATYIGMVHPSLAITITKLLILNPFSKRTLCIKLKMVYKILPHTYQKKSCSH